MHKFTTNTSFNEIKVVIHAAALHIMLRINAIYCIKLIQLCGSDPLSPFVQNATHLPSFLPQF